VLATVAGTAIFAGVYILFATIIAWPVDYRFQALKAPVSSNLLLWAFILVTVLEFSSGVGTFVGPLLWVVAFFVVWREIAINLKGAAKFVLFHASVFGFFLTFLILSIPLFMANNDRLMDRFAFKADPIAFFGFLSLINNVRIYLKLEESKRYKFSFLLLILLVIGAFGISLGIGLKIGFLSNLYLLSATLGTGVLSTFLFFFAPLQRLLRIFAYHHQSDKNLIKP
jgi:hypothetical protein